MNNWALSFAGLRTVVELELKQRVRSRRWIWALVAWVVLIGAVTGLIMWAAAETSAGYEGAMTFGVITFFVLGMGLMIAPAFTATSINGDRTAGTLATLQATRLSAFEIAAGKLIAAWIAAALFLVAALPFIVMSMLFGNISAWQVLVVFAVLMVEVAVICAIGLGWSASIARTAGSTLMTYLSVVSLTVISGIVMSLLMIATPVMTTVRVWGLSPEAQTAWDTEYEEYWAKFEEAEGRAGGGGAADVEAAPVPPVDKCTWREEAELTHRPDNFWGLLVINPFVIVADAAPLPPGAAKDLAKYDDVGGDPLASIRLAVRKLGMGPKQERDDCVELYSYVPGYEVTWTESNELVVTRYKDGKKTEVVSPVTPREVNVETPIWPWGLGFNLLLGAIGFWSAVRGLSIPYRKLAKGTRIA